MPNSRVHGEPSDSAGDSLPPPLEKMIIARDQAKGPAIAIETYFFNRDGQERHNLSWFPGHFRYAGVPNIEAGLFQIDCEHTGRLSPPAPRQLLAQTNSLLFRCSFLFLTLFFRALMRLLTATGRALFAATATRCCLPSGC